jgi:hypothetical protein
MGSFGGPLTFWPRLLRSPRACAIRFEGYLLGHLPQRADHRSGTYAADELPRILWDGKPHAVRGWGDVGGDIVERACLGQELGAMHAAQCRPAPRQPVLGHQGQAKSAQGRLGIAQRVDCRMAVRCERLERGLQRPALAVEPGETCGRGLAPGAIGQDGPHPSAVSCGLITLYLETPQQGHASLGIPPLHPRRGEVTSLKAAHGATCMEHLQRESRMLA